MTMNIVIMCRNVAATFMLQTLSEFICFPIYFTFWTENDKLNPMRSA